MSPYQQQANQWLKDLREIPEQEQKEWVIQTLRHKHNLHIFGKYFFPKIVETDIPQAHGELITELSREEDSAIIFPRGFGKSSWEKIDTIHDIVYGIEPVIVYVSVTLQDAGFHFESIKTELENNELLRFVYGNLVPPMKSRESVKWTNHHFETLNGVNVVARGANKGRGVNIKNQRPTKIIVDDAEHDEQVKSAVRRRKYQDWLYKVIIPSKDTNRGRVKIIGTVIHPDCEVLNFYNEKGGIFKRATIDGTLDTESIWPELWTKEKLIETKESIGTRAFMQEYMQEPLDDDLARIKPIWIDDNIYTTLPGNTARLHKVIAVDPQAGESGMADEYAITVVAWYTGDAHRYVLEQKAGRMSQMQQAIEIIKMWQKHKDASVVGIEKVLSQVAVYNIVAQWRAGNMTLDGVDGDDRSIPVRAITPEGKDKIARLEAHDHMIERGELHIRPEMKMLREQILFMGTGTLDHDDRVDSLIMALDLSLKYGKDTHSLKGLSDKSKTIAGNLYREKF